MRTAKQLNDIYIKNSMHNSKVDNQKESSRMGVILHIYPKVNVKFCEAVEQLVYKNNTVHDRIKMRFGFKDQTDFSKWTQLVFGKYGKELVTEVYNRETKEVRRRILSYFEKHRIELNNILNSEKCN